MSGGKELASFAAVVAGDVLSAFNIPGGNTISRVTDAYLAKRRKIASELLIEAIRKGSDGPIEFGDEADPIIEVIHRFSRAVDDGAAVRNLRLLAQIVGGMKGRKAVDPDEFRKWSAILALLTRDELIVIGKAIALQETAPAGQTADDFPQRHRAELKLSGYDDGEIEALLISVSRTGLLSPVSAWGGLNFLPTPWLMQLSKLVDLSDLS